DPGDARVVEQRVGIVEDQARATRAPDDRGPGLPQEEGERHLGSGPGPSHGIGEAAAIAWRAHLRDRGGPDDCGPETRVQEQVHGQAPNDPPSPGEGKGVARAHGTFCLTAESPVRYGAGSADFREGSTCRAASWC